MPAAKLRAAFSASFIVDSAAWRRRGFDTAENAPVLHLPSRTRREAIESRGCRICSPSIATASGLPFTALDAGVETHLPGRLRERQFDTLLCHDALRRRPCGWRSHRVERLCMCSSASLRLCVVSLPIRVMWVLPWPQVLTQKTFHTDGGVARSASAVAGSSSTVSVSLPALPVVEPSTEVRPAGGMKKISFYTKSVSAGWRRLPEGILHARAQVKIQR